MDWLVYTIVKTSIIVSRVWDGQYKHTKFIIMQTWDKMHSQIFGNLKLYIKPSWLSKLLLLFWCSDCFSFTLIGLISNLCPVIRELLAVYDYVLLISLGQWKLPSMYFSPFIISTTACLRQHSFRFLFDSQLDFPAVPLTRKCTGWTFQRLSKQSLPPLQYQTTGI